MKTVLSTTVMMILMLMTLLGASLFAEEITKPAKAPMKSIDPSSEMRANMATMHEKMAVCLRSEKSWEQCRDEMADQCQALGKEGCYMMQRGGKRGK